MDKGCLSSSPPFELGSTLVVKSVIRLLNRERECQRLEDFSIVPNDSYFMNTAT